MAEAPRIVDLSNENGLVGLHLQDGVIQINVRWPLKGRWKHCEFQVEGVDLMSAPLLLEIAAGSLHETLKNGGEMESIEEPPSDGNKPVVPGPRSETFQPGAELQGAAVQ